MAKKINVGPEKKSLSPNPYWHVLFAKNGVQIGQIWPLWPHQYFTAGYRGSPPCTLSQYPDNRETGYSNVLTDKWIQEYMIKWLDCLVLFFQLKADCKPWTWVWIGPWKNLWHSKKMWRKLSTPLLIITLDPTWGLFHVAWHLEAAAEWWELYVGDTFAFLPTFSLYFIPVVKLDVRESLSVGGGAGGL